MLGPIFSARSGKPRGNYLQKRSKKLFFSPDGVAYSGVSTNGRAGLSGYTVVSKERRGLFKGEEVQAKLDSRGLHTLSVTLSFPNSLRPYQVPGSREPVEVYLNSP